TIRIPVDDVDVPALDITELLQTLREATPMCGSCRRYRGQDSDKRPPGRTLGDDGTRPRDCRTTNKRNEFPPPHARPPDLGGRQSIRRLTSVLKQLSQRKSAEAHQSVAGQPLPFAPSFSNIKLCRSTPTFRRCRGWKATMAFRAIRSPRRREQVQGIQGFLL